jgi:hypothetical protein
MMSGVGGVGARNVAWAQGPQDAKQQSVDLKNEIEAAKKKSPSEQESHRKELRESIRASMREGFGGGDLLRFVTDLNKDLNQRLQEGGLSKQSISQARADIQLIKDALETPFSDPSWESLAKGPQTDAINQSEKFLNRLDPEKQPQKR